MDMKQFGGCHWVQDIIEPLLVWLEKEKLSPEAFGGSRILESVIIGENIEEVQIELYDLGLESIWPKLLG